MAIDLYIPRIEWRDVAITGTLATSSTTISSIADTSEIQDGMIVIGDGIPEDTTVVSKTSSTITISNAATSTGTESLDLFYRFNFTYPPTIDSEDKLRVNNKVSESISGIRQIQTNFIFFERDLEFGFVTKAQINTLQRYFLIGWASLGKQFRYFTDKEDEDFETYELRSFNFDRVRQVKKHPEFLYKIRFSFRRVNEGGFLITEDDSFLITEMNDLLQEE